jgi:hypothetical protein
MDKEQEPKVGEEGRTAKARSGSRICVSFCLGVLNDESGKTVRKVWSKLLG